MNSNSFAQLVAIASIQSIFIYHRIDLRYSSQTQIFAAIFLMIIIAALSLIGTRSRVTSVAFSRIALITVWSSLLLLIAYNSSLSRVSL